MVAPTPHHRPQMRSIHGVAGNLNGGGGGGGGNTTATFDPGYVIPASFMNSFRVTSVAERLAKLVRSGSRFDHRQFFNLCVTLARGIDYAVANNDVPAKAHELPALLRQVYQHKNEMLLQAAIMMVMISVKSACKSGWFLAKDADMLLTRTNELGMSFCNPADVVSQPENPPPVVSKVLERSVTVKFIFTGNYAVIIAFTSEVSSNGLPDLQHYARPLSSAHDLDSEIIEGASRISLNCPISFRRLTTPVKGQLCKHHQCFDYANYIKINSRRPSWRCPQCNQSVCYTDLRIDQRMVEVLKEVGDNVADVIISADGSWQPIRESDDSTNKQDKTLGNERNESNQYAPARFSVSAASVVDLTMEGVDDSNAMDTCENEDVKPLQNSAHANAGIEFDITGIQNEDSFWSGVQFSNLPASNEPVTPNTRLDPMSHPSSADNMLIPVLTDAITPTHNRDPGDVHWNSQSTNSLMRNYSVPDDLSLQRSGSVEYGDLIMNGVRTRARTPVAVQALPAQPLVPVSRQRPRPSLDYPMSNGAQYGGATETQQQQISRSDASFTSDMLSQPYPRFAPTAQ
ncbi:hypothetical protein MKW94_016982, partial [Papaver nudicaule]|nr:hypothetical protein [Papaver nudicaule]